MRKTKIIATISNFNTKFLKDMVKVGVNCFRINSAHITIPDLKTAIKNIRKVTEKIPIMVDTKGPEIRTTDIKKEIKIIKNQKIIISNNPKENEFKVNYHLFIKKIKLNSEILIEDGTIILKVIKKQKDKLICISKNDGFIKNKKSVNVPNNNFNLPSLNQRDKEFIKLAKKENIDFIAHSFVRNKKDLLAIKKILGKSKCKIISKIENNEGIKNIDEIIQNSYGIMVARGDLGVELPLEKIPKIQKELIKKCIEKKKIVITATQMLHSMIENPQPTRAEVSDVANAIHDGTDAIMLSGETAIGKYPIESVQIMSIIAREAENGEKTQIEVHPETIEDKIATFLSEVAVKAALKLPIKAIVSDTVTGKTGRYLSAFRANICTFIICYDKRIVRELALSYGLYPEYQNLNITRTSNIFIKKTIIPLLKKKIHK